ncbi:MAG: fumarylacetoacetase [Acidobacteriota bacterium]|nr:fumarylacetoacetase [Acidobacteriota bacterium]
MNHTADHTHNPLLHSWVESANQPETDFPIQNLPFGVFVPPGASEGRVGVAIGDQVLDLRACSEAGLFKLLDAAEACRAHRLNDLMALTADQRKALRGRLVELLKHDAEGEHRELAEKALFDQDAVRMLMPARVGDYTDFYASVHHATNVGSMFRPDNPLLPNYKHIPIGYHGRASSLLVSGTPVRRPEGQLKGEEGPGFGSSKLLDYEMEVGIFIGPGNALGESVSLDEAEDHLVGLCLVNDWSARDIQAWEYQPLGPFLAKSFATSVSPWVVTAEALAPFRVPAFQRPGDDPSPLEYLHSDANQRYGGFDLQVEVWLQTEAMRKAGHDPVRLSHGFFKDLYWTPAQMITHHTSNGCDLHPGDLLASGTVSGPERHNRGCLLELTWRGAEPLELPGGETRKFLEDGDEVILRGYCERDDYVRIGFGECRGQIIGR